MTPEPKVVVIEPNGPQGLKLAVRIQNKEQFEKFDKAVGKLPLDERQTVDGLTKAAKESGIDIIKD